MSPSLGSILVRLGVVTPEKIKSSSSLPRGSSPPSSSSPLSRGTNFSPVSNTTRPAAVSTGSGSEEAELAEEGSDAGWQLVQQAQDVYQPAFQPLKPHKAEERTATVPRMPDLKRARESTLSSGPISPPTPVRFFKKAKTADENLSNLWYVKNEAARYASSIEIVAPGGSDKSAIAVAGTAQLNQLWKDNLLDFRNMLDVAIELADEYTAASFSKAALILTEELAPYANKRLDATKRKDAMHIRHLADGTALAAEGIAEAILAAYPAAMDATGRRIEDRLTILRTANQLETVLNAIYEGEHKSNRPVIPRYTT